MRTTNNSTCRPPARQLLPGVRFKAIFRSLRVPNWPAGNQRVTAIFRVLGDPGQSQQAIRETTGAPRFSPSGRWVRIAIGEDDRTYIIGEFSDSVRFIMHGSMRTVLIVRKNKPFYAAIGEAMELPEE